MTTKTTSNLTMTIPPSQEQVKHQLSTTYDNSNPQQGTSMVGATPPPEGNQAPMTPTVKPHAEAVPGRTNMMKSPPTKKDSRKLFVGGLPSDVVESEFREFFEQFGEVLDSVVMFDRETRRSRGFGFVTFRDPEVAETLLNTRQDEETTGEGVAGETENGQRVGRLVMRGKTCEVKAAEPKEASKSARRGYQNQGYGGGAHRRYNMDKSYNSQGSDRQATAPYVGGYHDPHFIAGHHYAMMHPSYYPTYHHPGVYAGGAYHPAPMYAPMGPAAAAAAAAAVPAHLERLQPVVPQPVVPPLASPQVEGAPVPYTDSTYQEAGAAGPHYAYGHPYDMVHPSYPAHAVAQVSPKQGQHYPANYGVQGTSPSAMHPAAPGIPQKDEK